MGKFEPQLPLQQQQNHHGSPIFCERCSMALSRIRRLFSFKCVFILLLSISVFLSAIFWVFPSHARQYGFDAKDAIKLSATVQAYFRLQMPISLLVPQIARLEYDINAEIGVPDTKVAILSMHQAGASNWTNVVFGVLSDPLNIPINAVSLSVLRSSLIELFLQQSNLTLTSSIFGQPSSFEIVKFVGGITIIPEQSPFWKMPETLFNFTLRNSIYEIKENLVELKEQLKSGLHLKPDENIYVLVTNKNGSTMDPPVIVQAAVWSDLGGLLPERLKQLAEAINPAKNLGLNNSVFGKVKEIRLSSYLNHTIDATPPTAAPASSPRQNDYAESSPCSTISTSYSPAPSPNLHHLPCPQNGPHHSLPPLSNSPDPSIGDTHSPRPSPSCGTKVSPIPSPTFHSDSNSPDFPPRASPFQAPTSSRSEWSSGLSPLSVESPSSSSTGSSCCKQISCFFFFMLTTLHLLLWST